MENHQDIENVDGLKIEIRKNRISFRTPDGQEFYKNYENFLGVLRNAAQNAKRATYTLAPREDSHLVRKGSNEYAGVSS